MGIHSILRQARAQGWRDDTVEYAIFPDPGSFELPPLARDREAESDEAVRRGLEALRVACLDIAARHAGDMRWNRDPFQLWPAPPLARDAAEQAVRGVEGEGEEDPPFRWRDRDDGVAWGLQDDDEEGDEGEGDEGEKADSAGGADKRGGERGQVSVPAHLYGRTQYGASVEDEWVVVWLLLRISACLPFLSIRVRDGDGDFVLIEAATVLPKWVAPSCARNRLLLRQGRLHLVHPRLRRPPYRPAALHTALAAVRSADEPTEASEKIHRAVMSRLEGLPGSALAAVHTARCRLPIRAAQVSARAPAQSARPHSPPLRSAPLLLIPDPSLLLPTFSPFYPPPQAVQQDPYLATLAAHAFLNRDHAASSPSHTPSPSRHPSQPLPLFLPHTSCPCALASSRPPAPPTTSANAPPIAPPPAPCPPPCVAVVDVMVGLPRACYAQLALLPFSPPRAFPLPFPSDPLYPAALLGCKLALGLHLLSQGVGRGTGGRGKSKGGGEGKGERESARGEGGEGGVEGAGERREVQVCECDKVVVPAGMAGGEGEGAGGGGRGRAELGQWSDLLPCLTHAGLFHPPHPPSAPSNPAAAAAGAAVGAEEQGTSGEVGEERRRAIEKEMEKRFRAVQRFAQLSATAADPAARIYSVLAGQPAPHPSAFSRAALRADDSERWMGDAVRAMEARLGQQQAEGQGGGRRKGGREKEGVGVGGRRREGKIGKAGRREGEEVQGEEEAGQLLERLKRFMSGVSGFEGVEAEGGGDGSDGGEGEGGESEGGESGRGGSGEEEESGGGGRNEGEESGESDEEEQEEREEVQRVSVEGGVGLQENEDDGDEDGGEVVMGREKLREFERFMEELEGVMERYSEEEVKGFRGDGSSEGEEDDNSESAFFSEPGSDSDWEDASDPGSQGDEEEGESKGRISGPLVVGGGGRGSSGAGRGAGGGESGAGEGSGAAGRGGAATGLRRGFFGGGGGQRGKQSGEARRGEEGEMKRRDKGKGKVLEEEREGRKGSGKRGVGEGSSRGGGEGRGAGEEDFYSLYSKAMAAQLAPTHVPSSSLPLPPHTQRPKASSSRAGRAASTAAGAGKEAEEEARRVVGSLQMAARLQGGLPGPAALLLDAVRGDAGVKRGGKGKRGRGGGRGRR
ncbi:unnamed protein product [Closterium sp. Naga37s-1]|nr:unnamed protein product [Closterium sp. Naga37s-1]